MTGRTVVLGSVFISACSAGSIFSVPAEAAPNGPPIPIASSSVLVRATRRCPERLPENGAIDALPPQFAEALCHSSFVERATTLNTQLMQPLIAEGVIPVGAAAIYPSKDGKPVFRCSGIQVFRYSGRQRRACLRLCRILNT